MKPTMPQLMDLRHCRRSYQHQILNNLDSSSYSKSYLAYVEAIYNCLPTSKAAPSVDEVARALDENISRSAAVDGFETAAKFAKSSVLSLRTIFKKASYTELIRTCHRVSIPAMDLVIGGVTIPYEPKTLLSSSYPSSVFLLFPSIPFEGSSNQAAEWDTAYHWSVSSYAAMMNRELQEAGVKAEYKLLAVNSRALRAKETQNNTDSSIPIGAILVERVGSHQKLLKSLIKDLVNECDLPTSKTYANCSGCKARGICWNEFG